jgi:hypothetical protein
MSESESKIETQSDAFLNQVSLDYLINKKQYKNQFTSFSENSMNKKTIRKDKKFYRRRIVSLTKDLLYKEESEIIVSPDIKYAFDNFIKTCINYFKLLDTNDIIQKDYNEFDSDTEITDNKTDESEFSQKIKEENEKLLMRSVKISNHSLDNFIKIKMTKKPEDLIIPQQKEIDLKDPILKNKGVIKKKNIINNYGEDTKKQSNEIYEIQKDEK